MTLTGRSHGASDEGLGTSEVVDEVAWASVAIDRARHRSWERGESQSVSSLRYASRDPGGAKNWTIPSRSPILKEGHQSCGTAAAAPEEFHYQAL